MHPRAIVGPPGTQPNPHAGMPRLRYSWRRTNPVYPSQPMPVPGVDMMQLAYGSGVHPAPTSSMQIPAAAFQANPRRGAMPSEALCVSNAGQGWSVVLKVGGKPTKAYKATVSESKQAYGQIWWRALLAPQADFPNGLDKWLPRCDTERLGTQRNPVSVGACFPKFDPIAQYQVGRPPPAPNMASVQVQGQVPVIDPVTRMPRLRSRIWHR